ncbi:hypothetical protein CANARDRAFT_186197, partial [[Candida] arabinofermentans NRRL YB-2248]
KSSSTSSIIRFESWNLRYDSMSDSISINETISSLNSTIPQNVTYYTEYEEYPWSDRRIGIKNDVIFNKVDIFTVNEGLERQVNDLSTLLNMSYIGVGRNDGGVEGEYEAVFYNVDKFKVIKNDTFWLSLTPYNASLFKGAGSIRSCTVVGFREIETNVEFTVINLHLDDQSDSQRRFGIELAKYRAAFELDDDQVKGPVFLVGDFNSEAYGDTDGAYLVAIGNSTYNLTSSGIDDTFLKEYKSDLYESGNFTFDDLLESCEPQYRMGNLATFTGFNKIGSTSKYTRIDFQFGSNANDGRDKQFDVKMFKVGENWYDDSFYLTDHRPVITDLLFKPISINTSRLFAVGRSTTATRLFTKAPALTSSSIATKLSKVSIPLVGVSLGLAVGSTILHQTKLHNDYANQVALNAEKKAQDLNDKITATTSTSKYDGAFGGKLNYQELSIGSMFGVIAGLVVGKLSSVIMFASLAFYLSLQFLNSRNIISLPFTKVIKVGSQVIDIREMVFEKPSFNITFILAFVLAAY